MTIYDLNGDAFYEAPITKNAIIKYALMGDYYISLSFNAARYIDFKRGYYILHDSKKFEIMTTVRPERSSAGGYKYEVRFDAQQEHMKRRCLFWLDGAIPEATFHDTTTLDAYGKLIADNMNAFLGVQDWSFGDAPSNLDGVTKTITFDGSTCWDAINAIAEAFEVEWWIEEDLRARIIYFGKLEKGEAEPFTIGDAITEILSNRGEDADYGTRFYVFGSDRNLPDSYGTTEQGGVTNHVSQVRLHLPSGTPYIDAKADLKPAEVVEKVVIFDDVSPKNTDTITAIETIKREIIEGEENDAYVMTASDTPFVPSDLMSGETLMCEFTSGSLMGRQFELALLDDNNENINPEAWKEGDAFNKRFEIIAQTEDAGNTFVIVPNSYLHPVVGDTFVLIGVELPQERIAEAEQELLSKGQEHAAKNSSDTDVYECPTNPVYCHRHDKNFVLGQKVELNDPRFEGGKRESRIQGFEKKLWNEYEATYTVGDNTPYSRLGAIQEGIDETKHEIVKVKETTDRQFATTKRDMKDMQQTTSMLVESLLANFGDAISPVVVKTMMTLIGDESLQFRWVNSKETPTVVNHIFSFDPETKVFYTDGGIIQHMTIGISTISSSLPSENYRFWDVASFTSDNLEDMEASYYLYVKVEQEGTTGEFVLSETAIEMEQEEGYYHLLTGILNSENNKDRSFVSMYGYTEILPGRITTDTLTSPDGNLVIDLASGTITGPVTLKNGSSISDVEEFSQLVEKVEGMDDDSDGTDYVIWFAEIGAGENYIPTLENYPANDWTTDEILASHEWDMFYNRYSGRAWRFLEAQWKEITDADTIAALTKAAEAKQLADNLQYIKDALGENDTTSIDGGVVLSSFIGVKNGEKIVAALMNAAKGLPYFAAGIDDITDANNKSKLVIAGNGDIIQRDLSDNRSVLMSVGELRYMLGSETMLSQTPDKYEATPDNELMFNNLANEQTEDITVFIGSEMDRVQKTYPLQLQDTSTDFIQLGVIQAGDIYQSAATSADANLSLSVSGVITINMTITPQIRNSKGTVLSEGEPKQITDTLAFASVGSVSAVYSGNKNERLIFGLKATYTATANTGEIMIPLLNITIPAGYAFKVTGNVQKSAYANLLFGNGFFYAKSASQYVGALVDDDSGAVFEMRNGNNGFRFSANGLQKFNGTGWVAL